MTIDVQIDSIFRKRLSLASNEICDEAEFHSSSELLEFMVSEPGGENIIRAELKEKFRKDPAYKQYRQCRSLIKNSPFFKRYRSTLGSKYVHTLAKQVASDKSVSSQQRCLLDGLSSEIQISKTKFAQGQIVFHGMSLDDAQCLYTSRTHSFLSTSLSMQVAYWHAKKRAKPVVYTDKFENTPLVLELELTEPLNGFFAPVGKPQEYEILFDRFLKIIPSGSKALLSNGTVLQKARLQKG